MPRQAMLLWAASLALTMGAELPDLCVSLGETNRNEGLSVPSGGDGENRPDVAGGQPVRRIADGSLYLYVRIDHPAYEAAAPMDLYVTAEAVDDDFNRVSLQYDRAAASPNIGTKYTNAEGSAILLGKGGARRLSFFLPRARIGHGQNHHADLRFCARNLAVHSIAVTPRRPEGFRAAEGVDAESIRALRVERAPGVELTLGNDAGEADAAIFRALSVTSVESYVHWAGVEPDTQGHWDWGKWDEQVAILQRHGLKWVPFLIAGPAYATPLWFHGGEHSHYFRCLEHGEESKVQTIFNPHLPAYVQRFLAAFAERYRETGVIESVLLGVTGIYGESIYPAGPQGGWTAQLTGDYHNHGGWWAGDEYAVAAFRRAMRRKYVLLFRLNRAWGTSFGSWNEVTTLLPDKAPSDRARSDMARWYQEAMTAWSVFWVRKTRECFPDTEVYLCTGGDGRPVLGADFTAQARAIAPYGAGIRITNEASDLAANFTVTREAATATAVYGTFAGFEPAGKVDAHGVVARIYNAAASGVRQLHYYHPNILQSGEALANFRNNAHLLVPHERRTDMAFYVSRETWEVDDATVSPMYAHARLLRDLTDFDMVTRRSVGDGGLKGHRALLVTECDVLYAGAAAAIERWVRRGGVLIAATRPGRPVGGRLEDRARWRRRLLAPADSATELLRRETAEPIPEAWTLELGTPEDGEWIFGDWFHRERGLEWPDVPGARKRWSGARPGVHLPTKRGADYTLRLQVCLSGHSIRATGNTVSVNGVEIGRFTEAGTHVAELRAPATVLSTGAEAELTMDMNTWVPKEHGGSSDARSLGVALHRVTWFRAGADPEEATGARTHYSLEATAMRRLTRSVKKGWTVNLPGLAEDAGVLNRVLAVLLRQTDRHLPGVLPLAPHDGRLDRVYAAATDRGILRYDAARAAILTE